MAPLSNDDEVVDEDEVADPTHVAARTSAGKEEEKVSEDDEAINAQAGKGQKKQNILFPLMQSGTFVPPALAR